MARYGWLSLVAWGVGFLAVSGCSGDSGGARVTGTVFLDGKVLPSAGVQFWPKEELELGVYSGKTNAEGRFELSSRAAKSVKPGAYKVLITREVKKDGQVPGPGDDWNILKQPGALHNTLPPRYSDRFEPALTVEVHPGTNDFPFQLTSDP